MPTIQPLIPNDSATGSRYTTIDWLRHCGEIRHHTAAEVLFAIGDCGSEMYLIEEGTVDLFFAPGKKPKRLGPDELFGELAFIIGNHTRTATAVVTSPQARLRAFTQPVLNELLHSAPQEIFALVRHACAYLVDSEKDLLHQIRRQQTELELTVDYATRIREELTCYRDTGLLDVELGLLTRHGTLIYLDKLLNSHRSQGSGIALLLIELSGTDKIGKVLGIEFEEKILPWICNTLKQSVRTGDLIGRLGPDYLGVILTNADRALVTKIATTFYHQIQQQPLPLPTGSLTINLRLGAAQAQPNENAERLLQQASAALQLAPPSHHHTPPLGWHDQLIQLTTTTSCNFGK